MAFAEVTRRVHNPARKRRRMTAKQVRYFGSKRQKAALKASGGRSIRNRRAHRTGTTSRRPVRKNVGEVLIATLVPAAAGNPAGKGKAMEQTKRKRSGRPRAAGTTRRRRRAPMVMHFRRRHSPKRRNPIRTNRRHYRRRNPGAAGGGTSGIGSLVYSSIFVIVGAVGSKLATQAVLQANNTGIWGYAGNAIATFAMSFVAHKFMRNPAAARAIATGGVAQIVLRLMADYTPLGQFAGQTGLGDYMVSNFVTPQRYTDALRSAQIEIPAGWAPQIMAPVTTGTPVQAGAGMGCYSGSVYGGGELY
jgi:hypothetical protein